MVSRTETKVEIRANSPCSTRRRAPIAITTCRKLCVEEQSFETFMPWLGIPDNIFINRETHYRVQ